MAQQEHPSIGLWGGLGANLHAPDFSVNGIKYDRTATALGWNIGAGVSFPVASWIGLGVRAGYTRLDAELKGSTADSLLQRAWQRWSYSLTRSCGRGACTSP